MSFKDPVPVPKPCPSCGHTGALTIGMRLIAKPVGTFSLAGVMPKVSAIEAVGLGCEHCGMMLYGGIDADGKFVTTDPVPPPPADQPS